jgi:dihydropteroate synthase
MGIVNVTNDSFSGDGLDRDVDGAVAQAVRMAADGADVIDIGGESTRPRHSYGDDVPVPISVGEELERVLPVIERLAATLPVPISIDTSKQEVAELAVAAGATVLNDVWGLKRSPGLADLAARHGLSLVLMHNQDGTQYEDLMGQIKAELNFAIKLAKRAGVAPDRIVVDPGIGFGKDLAQNLEVLRRLGELRELGQPVMVGTSRKTFIGRVLDLPPQDRVEGTAATVAASILRGADMVRVHDVQAMVRVSRMSDALK